MTTSFSAQADIDVWYARYSPLLRRVALRIVGNTFDAEDAMQDAFLAAFRAHHRYRRDADPYPWLLRIATRKALTIAASARSGPLAVELVPQREAEPSAEEVAVAFEEARRVAQLVSSELPVALHLIDGLRFRDVSERLGIPPATAATRIRRGKQRLREMLAATSPNLVRSKSA